MFLWFFFYCFAADYYDLIPGFIYQMEEKRRKAKEAAKLAAAKKKAEKEALRRKPATDLFIGETEKYSKFDEQV